MNRSYLDLEIYKLSLELFIRVHRFSMTLPKHELYELGSQLRRSADSVNSNIVEGYGRKRYKNDFIRFLTMSHASNDETINHLRKIVMLYDDTREEGIAIGKAYNQLGRQLNGYIKYVESNWRS